MMLKDIFGKTIDAAKKSAQQMYGEDVALFENDGREEAADPATVDTRSSQENGRKDLNEEEASVTTTAREGVKFEFSGNDPQKKSNRLDSLRKYALEMSEDEKESQAFGESLQQAAEELNNEAASPTADAPMTISGATYSRSAIRKPISFPSDDKAPQEHIAEPEVTPQPVKEAPVQGKFITHFKARKEASTRRFQSSAVKDETRITAPATERRDERDLKIFHKRFDKLEGMMNASLITSGLSYVSHPAFQQLVETGMSPAVVTDWFKSIVHEGIDPYEQESRFMQELAGTIRKSLGNAAVTDPQKFMLFTGPTGCGKSSLIMKLCRTEVLGSDKQIAVAEVLPSGAAAEDYFSPLLPFCEKYGFSYFRISSGAEAGQVLQEFEDFDHVLIDTPSLSINKEHAFREFWKLRQMLMPFAPMEIHYVVRASMSRYYFRNSSDANQPVQPDHISITHVDEVSEFGPLIAFLKDMECDCRYMSCGRDLVDSLRDYDPQALARKILEKRG